MRLRQACCNPRLIDPDTASFQLQTCGLRLRSLRSSWAAAIRPWSSASLSIISISSASTWTPRDSAINTWTATHQPKQRQQRIDAFQTGEGDLFLISLKAGGLGLNLTAADYVIHMDPWWNPAVEDQASDRAHRIGQTRPVTIYRLVARHHRRKDRPAPPPQARPGRQPPGRQRYQCQDEFRRSAGSDQRELIRPQRSRLWQKDQ